MGLFERELLTASFREEIPVWRTTLQTLETMLKDRKYTQVVPRCQGEEPRLICSCKDSRGDAVLIYTSNEIKVGVKSLRKIHQESCAADAKHSMLISKEGLTPFAIRELKDLNESFDIETFRRRELCFPVIHHSLVPRHLPLSKEEKHKLVADLGGKASFLPKLKDSDPVARYLHLQPGTVVKIERRIGTLEPEPYFRIVVS